MRKIGNGEAYCAVVRRQPTTQLLRDLRALHSSSGGGVLATCLQQWLASAVDPRLSVLQAMASQELRQERERLERQWPFSWRDRHFTHGPPRKVLQ